MLDRKMSDAALKEDCAECNDLLASYVEGCRLLEEVEANPAKAHRIEEVQRRVVASRRQWQAALARIGQQPAYTIGGIMAKGAAMYGYMAECSPEDESAALARSLLKDMQRRFGG